MHLRLGLSAQVIGGEHDLEGAQDRARRVGEEGGDTGERLLSLSVEDVQDGPGQQRMGRLLPVVAALLRPFRINQDVGDVLHVAHLLRAFAHLQQRVETGGQGVGGIEQQAVREPGAPACRQRPVLALDVVDDGRLAPRQERWQHQADAFARPRRRHGENVLGAVVTQVAAIVEAEHDALTAQQPRGPDIGMIRPAGRAVGRGLALEAGPPGGSPDGDGTAGNSPERSNDAGARKHVGGLRIERQPPDEQFPGCVNLEPEEFDHGGAERRLIAEHGGRPLRRRPHANGDEEQCGADLKANDPSRRHR